MPIGLARAAIFATGGGGGGEGGGGGGEPPAVNKSLSYVTSTESSTSGTYTISIPSTTQTGDIAFLFDRINVQSTNNTTPSGFTNITTYNGSTHKWTLSYKILTSGDPNTSVTGQSTTTTTAHRKLMLFYRPNWTIATVSINDLEQNAVIAVTTIANQTLSMSSLTEPGIGFAFYGFGSTGTHTRGSTLSTDGQGTVQEYTQGSVLYVKTFLWDQDDTATNATISMSTASNQQMGLFTYYAQLT